MDRPSSRPQRTYDHRLRDLVQTVGDPKVVLGLGVPRSTVQGWLRGERRPVVTADVLDMDAMRLQAEVLEFRRRVRMPAAVVGLLVALLRALGVRLEQIRLPEGAAKTRLIRAIDRARARPCCKPLSAYRLIRERGWGRPRIRVHPAKPTNGVRATEPDEMYYGRGHGIPEQLEEAKSRAARGAGPRQSSGIVRGLPGGEPDYRGGVCRGMRARRQVWCCSRKRTRGAS